MKRFFIRTKWITETALVSACVLAVFSAFSTTAQEAADVPPSIVAPLAEEVDDNTVSVQAATPVELPPLPDVNVDVSRFTLENGLQGLAIVNKKIPAVVHALWYRTGAMDEPPGQSGIAHLFEHLMFKGSETFSKGELSRKVAASGGEDNAFTMQDATGYYQYVPVSSLPEMMAIEADRMRHLRFTQADLDTEREVVLQERLMRTENRPGARLSEQMRASLFLHHPYGTPVIGWEHEIKGLNLEQLQAFYSAHYAPDNAVLVVAGDIDPEDIKTLAEQHYGDLKPSGADKTSFAVLEEPSIRPAETRVTLRDPLAGGDKWVRLYTAPSYKGEQTPKETVTRTHALSVLCYMLAGAEDSPMYRYLVNEQKITTGFDCGYSPQSRGPSAFSLSVSLPEGTSLAQAEEAIEAFLRDKKADSVTEAWTEEVKRRLIADRIFSLESMRSVAFAYGYAMTVTGDISYPELWQQRIADVTVNDVSAAYDAIFSPDVRAVTGLLTARPAFEQGEQP